MKYRDKSVGNRHGVTVNSDITPARWHRAADESLLDRATARSVKHCQPLPYQRSLAIDTEDR